MAKIKVVKKKKIEKGKEKIENRKRVETNGM